MVRRTAPVVLAWAACAIAAPSHADEQIKLIKLVADLNDSPAVNAAARAQLKALGEPAAKALAEEVARYKLLMEARPYSAARCLRCLREMPSAAAVAPAIEIVKDVRPKRRPEQADRVLLNEAVRYLADNGDRADARQAFYDFVLESQKAWAGKHGYYLYSRGPYDGKRTDRATVVHQLGGPTPYGTWEPARQPGMFVDILYGLGKMLQRRDAGAADVLAKLLPRLAYAYSIVIDQLGADGFTPQTALANDNADAGAAWPEPRTRPRVLIVTWLGRIKATAAAGAIRPLLASEHRDEREIALSVLNALADRPEYRKPEAPRIKEVSNPVTSGLEPRFEPGVVTPLPPEAPDGGE